MLFRKLCNLRSTEKEDLNLFLWQFDEVIADIRLHGSNMSELETICFLLPSYASIISSFREINEEQLLSMDLVKDTLLDYLLKSTDEMPKHKSTDNSSSSTSAFASKSNVKSKKRSKTFEKKKEKQTNKLYCNFCGKKIM